MRGNDMHHTSKDDKTEEYEIWKKQTKNPLKTVFIYDK